MYTLIWIIFVLFILILVAISEYQIAKQDEEWIKEEEKKWKKK
nr:MAG TPA: Sporulation protein YhaL [Caudoviricetes sp.]